MRRRSMIRTVTTLAILALLAAACGTGGGGGDDGDARSVIRFTFAPDPVWDYMNDQGMIVEWEEDHNTRIVTSATWDEFTTFAGGHGDIVSASTQEVPVLEQETGIQTVSFGKYNAQRSPMIKRAGDPYQELPDVPAGSTICVSSPVSNTQFWAVAMNELHGIDYRVGGGDYNLIVNDHFVNPQNLLNGDCEVAVIIPEAAAPYLRTGELELMYDGLMPFQLYNRFSGLGGEEAHVMSNLFIATEEYFDSHPDEIAAFLDLWQRGVDAWYANKTEIIETYPQHFAVQEPEDVQFIAEFMAGPNDWFVDSVYFTEEWIEAEQKIWEFQQNLVPENPNSIPTEGFDTPRFEVVAPPSS